MAAGLSQSQIDGRHVMTRWIVTAIWKNGEAGSRTFKEPSPALRRLLDIVDLEPCVVVCMFRRNDDGSTDLLDTRVRP